MLPVIKPRIGVVIAVYKSDQIEIASGQLK